MIQSSTIANSGGRVSSLRTGTVLTAGSIVDIRWRVLNPTNTTMFVGWTDANTITPTAMAAVAISGTSATPRILHSGTTTNGTGFTVAADTPYSTIVEVLSSSAARMLTTNLSTGVVLSDVTVSATIPTAAVGGMLFASNSGTAVTDLAVVHDFGMSPRGIGAA